MGSLGPTHLIALLLAVAIIASITGFVASAATRRNKRHARRILALGFVCGLMAGAMLRGRGRGLTTLAPRAFTVATSYLRPALLGLMGDRRAVPATGFLTRMRQNFSPRR
jgi:hypothetical protein